MDFRDTELWKYRYRRKRWGGKRPQSRLEIENSRLGVVSYRACSGVLDSKGGCCHGLLVKH